MALCYLDLDGFKPVNDQFGHAAGDQLLVIVTDRIKQILRSEDTLARLGGDEFAMLLGDLEDDEGIEVVLDRVLKSVCEPIIIDGNSVSVSVSIGYTIYPEDNGDQDKLLLHADQSMYMSKTSGKNCYHKYVGNQ